MTSLLKLGQILRKNADGDLRLYCRAKSYVPKYSIVERARKEMSVLERVERTLNDHRSPDKRRFDIFITVLILLSTAILFIGLSGNDNIELPPWLQFIDNAILVVFLLEYVGRLLFARPDMPQVIHLSALQKLRYHIQARLRWMITPMAIIDLLAILPIFAMDRSLGNFKLFRVIRILRLMRIYRIFAHYNPLRALSKAFRANSLLYVVAFSMVAVTILMGSISFYIVEADDNKNITNAWDAIWWTVVTLTTVGYGDTVPVTPLGRTVAMLLMISGVVLMAVFAGVMAQTLVGYLLDVRKERVRMSSTVNHVVICGWNSRGPMVCDELLHLIPDEEVIVFADMEEPLNMPEGVTFLRGDPSKESELSNVRLSMARNVIVLAPPEANSGHADGFTALIVYTVRSFEKKLARQGVERTVPLHICAELLDPENYKHLEVAGANEVVQTNQIGSNLVAHSSVKPGMSRVVTELLSWWGQGLDLGPLPEDYEEGMNFGILAKNMRVNHNFLVVGVMPIDGQLRLNPNNTRIVMPDDKLVLIRQHEEPEEL